ncbi:MAG: 4-hydroxy-tetrahydrodipicolinate synthase [Leptospiraceae bacterium]|nr:4-hydroxy-tetrahydrodipicolinate synthase [Leptospiraceae bacterium]MDW8305606.1 4-hydroxy-tetrahydrodipicolinate synthase [Leptospiraceae bacterium]
MLTGTFTALITPFRRGGEIDFAALKKIVEIQVQAGVEGLVPCGTTGESPTLSHEEHREVMARVIEYAKSLNPQIIIIAGTGSNSTEEAIELTRAAKQYGADYSLQVNPYYNKPTQEGLYRHFMAISEAVDIPLVLYNIPGRTGVTLSLETIKRLCQNAQIAAIKEASGDLNFMTQIVLEVGSQVSLLSGDDNLLLPILSIGGRGVISVLSNLFPAETAAITRAYLKGDLAKAQQLFLALFPLAKALFVETNPIPVKYAASRLGLCENALRLPLVPLSEIHEKTLDEALEAAKQRLR